MGEISCKSCANYKEEGCNGCQGFIHKTEKILSPREAFTLFMDKLKAPKNAEFRVIMENYLEQAEENTKKLEKINDILNMYYRGDMDDPIDALDLICDVA